MSREKKTVRFAVTQETGFNFEQSAYTTGALDQELVVRAFVNKLFEMIRIKKDRGGNTLRSLKLNKPFVLSVSGAIEFKVDEGMMTKADLPVKFKSALYKTSPKLAKQDMVNAILSVTSIVNDTRTLPQMAKGLKAVEPQLN